MDIDGEYTNVAIVVQLPDGRIAAQWGCAAVILRENRPPFDWGDRIPKMDHSTLVEWLNGYHMAYGMPDWARQPTNTPKLAEAQPAIEDRQFGPRPQESP